MFKKQMPNTRIESNRQSIIDEQLGILKKTPKLQIKQQQKQQQQQFQVNENNQNNQLQQNQLNSSQTKYVNRKINNRGSQQSNNQQQQSSEEEDSGKQSDYFRNARVKNNIHAIREQDDDDEDHDSDDNHINEIQQKIHKLQKDVQSKLNKHRIQVNNNSKDQLQKNGSKVSAHPPPIPKKFTPFYQQGENHSHNQNKKLAQSRQNRSQERKQSINTDKLNEEKKRKEENGGQSDRRIKNIDNNKNNKQKIRQINEQQQQKITKNNKIKQLQKIVKQLKKQNKQLKQKINQQNEKNIQISKYNDKIKNSQLKNQKLQKQLQLLTIIEKLQVKLKKSINKKLTIQGNATVTLLHKGLPTAMHT